LAGGVHAAYDDDGLVAFRPIRAKHLHWKLMNGVISG